MVKYILFRALVLMVFLAQGPSLLPLYFSLYIFDLFFLPRDALSVSASRTEMPPEAGASVPSQPMTS